MSGKLNCWEFRNCGREPGGLMVPTLGECPVSTAMKYDGLNGGVGAGRACWMVAGGGCRNGGKQRSPANPCHQCEFYKRVLFEQQSNIRFRFTGPPSALPRRAAITMTRTVSEAVEAEKVEPPVPQDG